MKAKMTILVAAGALLVAPALASAADRYGYGPGITVAGNGGVLTYPGEAARLFDPGAQYGVNIGLEPFGAVGLELGYAGAAYGLDGRDGSVVENGGTALLKVGPKLGTVQPYALGGYNLMWLSGNEDANARGIDDDTMSKIPVGAGVDFVLPAGKAPLILGARGTYNFLFDNDSFDVGGAESDDQIGGQVVFGGEF